MNENQHEQERIALQRMLEEIRTKQRVKTDGPVHVGSFIPPEWIKPKSHEL